MERWREGGKEGRIGGEKEEEGSSGGENGVGRKEGADLRTEENMSGRGENLT